MLTKFRAQATPIRTYWQNDSKVISWLCLLLSRNILFSLPASIVGLHSGISVKRVSEDVARRSVGKYRKGTKKRGKKSSSTYPLALTRLFLVCHTNQPKDYTRLLNYIHTHQYALERYQAYIFRILCHYPLQISIGKHLTLVSSKREGKNGNIQTAYSWDESDHVCSIRGTHPLFVKSVFLFSIEQRDSNINSRRNQNYILYLPVLGKSVLVLGNRRKFRNFMK